MVYTMLITHFLGSLFGLYITSDIFQSVLAVAVSAGVVALVKKCFTMKGVSTNECFYCGAYCM